MKREPCPGVTVVPMERRWIPAIASLEKECFAHPWCEETLVSELSNPTACFLVAVSDGSLIGYIGSNVIAGECYIADLAVTEKFRRRGVATLLLDTLCRTLVSQQAELMTLEVRKSNQKAISLYLSFGFQTVGVRPDFYDDPNEDALIMTKYLKSKDVL